jgi:hypothetical protein
VSEVIEILFPLPADPLITEPFPVDEIFVNMLVSIVKLLPEEISKSEQPNKNEKKYYYLFLFL